MLLTSSPAPAAAAMPPQAGPRQAEVHDLEVARREHHHVGRLHGPVHDATRMGEVQGHRQLAAQAQRPVPLTRRGR